MRTGASSNAASSEGSGEGAERCREALASHSQSWGTAGSPRDVRVISKWPQASPGLLRCQLAQALFHSNPAGGVNGGQEQVLREKWAWGGVTSRARPKNLVPHGGLARGPQGLGAKRTALLWR